jgi:two-component sensor histidine kinase
VAANEAPTRETLHALQRLQRLFEQAPGVMAVLHGPMHIFELTNAAYVNLVGPRDLIGKPVREALPEVEGQGFFELLDRVYTTGERFVGQGMAVQLQRTAGRPLERRHVDFVYQPILEDDGTISGIFIEGQDVTERVLAQAALKVLLEEKEALAQRNAAIAQELSHRMLNSFQVIETLFRFQADDLAEADPARLTLETARLRVQSMALVHRQIYRIEHGTGAQDIDLGLYLQSLAAELARAFGRGRTVIDVRALGGISMDARQAGTVGLLTTELVINACKYGFPDNRPGNVTIRLTQTGEGYRLVVEDTGIGLPAGFDPAASAGLGMRLVDSFVQNLEGQLTVDTRTAGEGARFTLTFPR